MDKKINMLSLVAGILTIILPWITAILFGIIAGIVELVSALGKWNIENGVPGLN